MCVNINTHTNLENIFVRRIKVSYNIIILRSRVYIYIFLFKKFIHSHRYQFSDDFWILHKDFFDH